VGRAPPLFPYCRVLVNHAYRTLYLKAPKTGSTSLLTLMGTCTGAATDKATCFEPLKVGAERGSQAIAACVAAVCGKLVSLPEAARI
jgi:hypothetical protein